MEANRIYESLSILTDKVTGLLVRVDYLELVLESEDNMKFMKHQSLAHVIKSKKPMSEIEQKTLSDLYESGTSKQDLVTAIRPHLETLLEVMDVNSAVLTLVSTMSRCRTFLDISTNTTLTRLTLQLVATLSILHIIVNGIKPALTMVLLYKTISDQVSPDIEVNKSGLFSFVCLPGELYIFLSV